MACCPFHNDNTPSLKIYPDHFYCFGCGESGDGTGFVAKLFRISQLEAAKKISYDFGLNLFNGEIVIPVKMKVNPNAEYLMWLQNAKADVSSYLDKLCEWREKYKPANPLVPFNARFIESLTKTSYVEFLDEMLTYGTEAEKRELYNDNRDVIENIHSRLETIVTEERNVKRKGACTSP